ncbi:MAG: ribonuclease P protein component [Prevotellaceae bacterium]|nr:ribonuclease P protein component [Candidatus Colivivens equi]MCQ2077595.1 ribonuclease P protein component [Bacteroidaceae bacterium]
MSNNFIHTLDKSERICSKLIVNDLFERQSASCVAFPIRVVYSLLPKHVGMADNAILVSVPKKKFHHAVDRNRIKRQIREAYRMNKDLLTSTSKYGDEMLAMAFVCITDQPCSSETINKSMIKLLKKISNEISK